MTATIAYPEPIDAAAVHWHGVGVLEQHRESLERAERAIARGVPRESIFGLLAPQLDPEAPALVHARRWADARGAGCCVLAGTVGSGKSLGAALWGTLVGATWISASEFGGWGYAEVGDRTDRLVHAPALVVDEVGGQGATSPVEVSRLSVVLLRRHADLRPSVLTTNLDRRAFARLVDGVDREGSSRLLDRIDDRGEWQVVAGKSRRRGDLDLDAGRARLEWMRRLRRLVSHAEGVAAGYAEPERGHGPVHDLAAMLRLSPAQLASARRTVDEQRARVDELLRAQLTKWGPRDGGLGDDRVALHDATQVRADRGGDA